MAKKKASKKRAPRKRRKRRTEDSTPGAPVEPTQDTSLFTLILDLPDLVVLARAVRPDLRGQEPEAVALEFQRGVDGLRHGLPRHEARGELAGQGIGANEVEDALLLGEPEETLPKHAVVPVGKIG